MQMFPSGLPRFEPPFDVPESEVNELFAGLRIDKLHEYDGLGREPRFRQRGLTWMREAVFDIA